MRWMKITENFGIVRIETSTGVKATGATVQSALQKLDLTDLMQREDFDHVAGLFMRIKDQDGPSNIGHGVASA